MPWFIQGILNIAGGLYDEAVKKSLPRNTHLQAKLYIWSVFRAKSRPNTMRRTLY